MGGNPEMAKQGTGGLLFYCVGFFSLILYIQILASHESSMSESLILVGRRHVLVQLFLEFTSSLTTCLFSLQFQFIASKSYKDLASMLYLVAVPQSTDANGRRTGFLISKASQCHHQAQA